MIHSTQEMNVQIPQQFKEGLFPGTITVFTQGFTSGIRFNIRAMDRKIFMRKIDMF